MSKKITVLEGSAFAAGSAKAFFTDADASAHVLSRVGALVDNAHRARFERAMKERIVSEDGQKATSEVIAGTLAFAKAMAAAFAPQVSVIASSYIDDKDD